jgi:hypothetical protein
MVAEYWISLLIALVGVIAVLGTLLILNSRK